MLHFDIKPHWIKIVRIETNPAGDKIRTRLAVLIRPDLEIPDRLEDVATPLEIQQIEELAELYRRAPELEAAANAVRLPDILQSALHHYTTNASAVERRLIEIAVQDVARAIKRARGTIHAA